MASHRRGINRRPALLSQLSHRWRRARTQALCVGLLVSVALGFACSSDPADDGDSCKEIPAVAAEARALTVGPDGSFVDTLGRQVILRGVNTGGRSKWSPYLPFAIEPTATLKDVRAAADPFFARLHGWGLDTVRMPFSWEGLEPHKGTWNKVYLDRFEVMVNAAHAANLRVIIDFHQDVFAATWCGDGFPLWTVDKSAVAAKCPDHQWFIRYAYPEVRDAFGALFANKDGLRDDFAAMWAKVAARFAKHPAVVGFEILNEPGGWLLGQINQWKIDVLTPFHEVMIAVIQKAAPGKLVFYDNPGYDALNTVSSNHVRPKGKGLVYAPHYYDAGLIGSKAFSGNKPRPYLEAVATFASQEKLPVLLGEFGYGAGSQTKGGPAWLRETMDIIDELRLSATIWEYSISDKLWNGEDLSLVESNGDERPVLDTYVRPWLRAVAGSKPTFTWDADAGVAQTTWTAADGVTELVLPPRLFPNGPKELKVSEGCATWDAERAELRVQAPAGAAVTVSFRRQ
ncbi:MAG: cellulase family glycosylhydrolase [Myxococcales bacterium]|nr:cellulase family glycosylhydrolase [Myxococcales bacterium]